MPQPLNARTLVYGFSSAGEPQVSPDGARLLYTLAKSDEKTKKTNSNVWMANYRRQRPGAAAHDEWRAQRRRALVA